MKDTRTHIASPQNFPPVALFVFNRSEQLEQTLEGLKSNNIPVLYVFADGARNKDDQKNVNQVRRLVDAITWTKVVKTYHKKNKGLTESIRDGLNSVFKEHEQIIVVEDDIYVAPDFYDYMRTTLDSYANNPNWTSLPF